LSINQYSRAKKELITNSSLLSISAVSGDETVWRLCAQAAAAPLLWGTCVCHTKRIITD